MVAARALESAGVLVRQFFVLELHFTYKCKMTKACTLCSGFNQYSRHSFSRSIEFPSSTFEAGGHSWLLSALIPGLVPQTEGDNRRHCPSLPWAQGQDTTDVGT